MNTKKKCSNREKFIMQTSCPNNIGSNELKSIIANALIKADEIRIQKDEEARKEKDRKWHEVIGYKDYSDKKGLAKWALRFINDVVILAKLPFIPKEKIETDWISWSLLKAAMVILFQFITYGFLLVSFVGLLFAIIQQKNIIYIILAFPIYALYGILRMATVEIDKIRDRNYLISLFTAIVTVISVIIAIVTAVRG